MIIVKEDEIVTNETINSRIRSGQLGVIENDLGAYELVYFTNCHYLGSSGGISNTFSYRSFSKNGILKAKVKNYMYKAIYGLKKDSKYKIDIILTKDEENEN